MDCLAPRKTAMDKPNCTLCGSSEKDLVCRSSDVVHGVPGSFIYVRCRHCGLVYLDPRPAPQEMHKYYPPDYGAYKRAIEDERFLLMRYVRRRKVARRCADIVRLEQPGRILDVGCSTGIFLAEMRMRGWDVYGVEPNEEVAAYARERMRLDVFPGFLEDSDFDDHYFDAVTFWDVFEHLSDPIGALKRIRRILKPGGLLVISLPNPNSLEAKLFGRYWVGLDAPRHLWCFKPVVLEEALTRDAFDVIMTRYFEGGYFTFVASARIVIAHRVRSQRIQRAANRVLHMPGLRLPFAPLFDLIDKLGKGSIVTVYSIRKGC